MFLIRWYWRNSILWIWKQTIITMNAQSEITTMMMMMMMMIIGKMKTRYQFRQYIYSCEYPTQYQSRIPSNFPPCKFSRCLKISEVGWNQLFGEKISEIFCTRNLIYGMKFKFKTCVRIDKIMNRYQEIVYHQGEPWSEQT